MKSLFESILSDDDLGQSIEDATIYDKIPSCFRFLHPNNTYHFDVKKDVLAISLGNNETEFRTNGIIGSELHALGINELKFNLKNEECAFLDHSDLSSLKITSTQPLYGVGYWDRDDRVRQLSDVKISAPRVDLYIQKNYRDKINNVKIKTDVLEIFTHIITPGMKKLNKLGFGNYALNKFTPAETDSYDSAQITDTVSFAEIVDNIITNLTAKYVIIEPLKARVTDGCYIIINPKYRSKFENLYPNYRYSIETLKDGWLITQYFDSMRVLRRTLSK